MTDTDWDDRTRAADADAESVKCVALDAHINQLSRVAPGGRRAQVVDGRIVRGGRP